MSESPFFTRPPGTLHTATIVMSAACYGLLAGLVAGLTGHALLSILAVMLFLGFIYGLMFLAGYGPRTLRGLVCLSALYGAAAIWLLWHYLAVVRMAGLREAGYDPLAGIGGIVAVWLVFNILTMLRRIRLIRTKCAR